MGTKALIRFEKEPGQVYALGVGMTADGFEDNLVYVATKYLRAKDKNPEFTHGQLLKETIKGDEKWFFTSTLEEASWLTNTGILRVDRTVEIENEFEGSNNTYIIDDKYNSTKKDNVVNDERTVPKG